MSDRTLVELNHDYAPKYGVELSDWAKALRSYLSSGDKKELPSGVTFVQMRHHTEPDLQQQLDAANQRIAGLTATVERQGDQIIEIRAANRHLREDLEAANQRIAELKAQVQELDEDVQVREEIIDEIDRILSAPQQSADKYSVIIQSVRDIKAAKEAAERKLAITNETFTAIKLQKHLGPIMQLVEDAEQALAQTEQPQCVPPSQQPSDKYLDVDFEQLVTERLVNGAKFQPRRRPQSAVAEPQEQLPGEDTHDQPCYCAACVSLRAKAGVKL